MFIKSIISVIAIFSLLVGCVNVDDATVAKNNLTKAADNFEINRRILFYNTWTDTIIQQVEGKCSIEYGNRVSLICKIGHNKYKRDFISLSGQVTVFVEQIEPLPVNVYHYRRTFKPQVIVPDIDFRGNSDAIKEAVTPDDKD